MGKPVSDDFYYYLTRLEKNEDFIFELFEGDALILDGKLFGRTIVGGDFIDDLKNGCLKPILKLVKDDDTLELELRGDHVTIYYRERSLADIYLSKRYNIFYKDEKQQIAHEDTKKHTYDLNLTFGQFLKFYIDKYTTDLEYNEIIENILKYKNFIDYAGKNIRHNSKVPSENEFSQLVKRDNNRNAQTDYVITDMEDTISIHGKDIEPDLIGFKFKGSTRSEAVLTLIETKYNDGAIDGTNGIQKHVEDFIKLLNQGDDFKKIYKQKHKCIFFDKVWLGLIKKTGFKGLDYDELKEKINNINITDLECLLVMSNYCPRFDKKQLLSTFDQEIKKVVDKFYATDTEKLEKVYIANANFMGTELYFWDNEGNRRFPNVLEYFVENIYDKLDEKAQKKYKAIKDKYTFDK